MFLSLSSIGGKGLLSKQNQSSQEFNNSEEPKQGLLVFIMSVF